MTASTDAQKTTLDPRASSIAAGGLPAGARPLGAVANAGVLASEIGRGMSRLLLRNIRRNRSTVTTEYDQGSWKKVLDEKRWLTSKDLKQFVWPNEDADYTAKVAGRLVAIRKKDYWDYRMAVLDGELRRLSVPQDEIVEIGCGFGKNLFALLALGHWKKVEGYDLSVNGIIAAREVSRHFGIGNAVFGNLDLIKGTEENFRNVQGKTVFSYFCMEQLKYHTRTVAENLIKAGVRRVIHFETTYELLRLSNPLDLATYFHVRSQDYQDNLLSTIRQLEAEGKARIIEVKRLFYSPTPKNDPTLICWEPVA